MFNITNPNNEKLHFNEATHTSFINQIKTNESIHISRNTSRTYYELSNSRFSIKDRIHKAINLLFKYLTSPFIFFKDPNNSSLWREIINNRKEIVIIRNFPKNVHLYSIPSGSPKSFSKRVTNQINLSNFCRNHSSFLSVLDKHNMEIRENSNSLNSKYIISHDENKPIHSHPFNNEELEIIFEHLRSFPEPFSLFLTGKKIQTLPENLGNLTNLVKLYLNNNLLQDIPTCFYRLPKSCTIYLEKNPLNLQAIELTQATEQAENYQGPHFIFWHHYNSDYKPLKDLAIVLTEWCDEECKQKILDHLSLIQKKNLSR
jgi:hypothetical protein